MIGSKESSGARSGMVIAMFVAAIMIAGSFAFVTLQDDDAFSQEGVLGAPVPLLIGDITVEDVPGRAVGEEGYRLLSVNTGVTGAVSLKNIMDGGDLVPILEIGPNAFKDCDKITSIELGPELEQVAAGAFSGCVLLEGLAIDGNAKFRTEGGVLFEVNADGTMTLLKYPDQRALTVKELEYADMRTYILPDNVRNVASYAFHDSVNLQLALPPLPQETVDGAGPVITFADNASSNMILYVTEFPAGLDWHIYDADAGEWVPIPELLGGNAFFDGSSSGFKIRPQWTGEYDMEASYGVSFVYDGVTISGTTKLSEFSVSFMYNKFSSDDGVSFVREGWKIVGWTADVNDVQYSFNGMFRVADIDPALGWVLADGVEFCPVWEEIKGVSGLLDFLKGPFGLVMLIIIVLLIAIWSAYWLVRKRKYQDD